jgi:hypothetical protein
VALRESGRSAGETFDLGAVTEGVEGAGGVRHGELLSELTSAVVSRNRAALDALRPAAVEALGGDGFVRAVGVAAGFDGINRVADIIGIPLDDERFADLEQEFWDATGIMAFGDPRADTSG